MPQFTIGGQTIHNWIGPPPDAQKGHTTILTKPGVTGVSAVRGGVHGDPTEFETVSFYSSLGNLDTAAIAMRNFIAGSGVTIVYAGTTITGWKYLVLDFTQIEIRKISHFLNIELSQNYTPAWRLTARWRIVAVPTTATP